jgi:hypothetical protein
MSNALANYEGIVGNYIDIPKKKVTISIKINNKGKWLKI